jgi:transposase-like protein
MTAEEREIRRKRRILDHAVQSRNIAKTCRYFGVPRSLFYVWRNGYQENGEEGTLAGRVAEPGEPDRPGPAARRDGGGCSRPRRRVFKSACWTTSWRHYRS